MANSEGPNLTAPLGGLILGLHCLPEKSDIGLHCLPRPELLKLHSFRLFSCFKLAA